MSDAEIRTVARALFDAENEWRVMQQGETGSPLDERAFKVQIAYWMLMANTAIEAIRALNSNGGGKS